MKNEWIIGTGSIKDSAAKQYFGKKEIFADLCNAFLFRQPGRLDASKLWEIPTEYNELLGKVANGYSAFKQERDLAFQAYTDGERGYAIICAELQSTTDATMPVRVMKYDSLAYAYQLQERIGNGGSFLPVTTIVVNLGRKVWNVPTSLYDMFPYVDDFVRSFVPNFWINVFDLNAVDEKIRRLLCTDLKDVVNLYRYSDDGRKLLSIYENDAFAFLSSEGVKLVNTCLDMRLKKPENGGRLEMCKAVQDIIEIGIERGIEKKAFDVAANALRLRMKQSDVCAITGLSQAQVAQLASKMGL
ncbi:MAG: Rpn family recombination-promoting nuclease/putative transposase [Victivallales bacterium]|nr:Rpn family recombination-promoting nuclease/putative transposase [Victivallales bacterium]